MEKILYGCCYKADLKLPGVTYVDVIEGLKKSHNCSYICKDIREINFNDFDIIICTPPCNYYSRCNYRRETSAYALSTKDLLPYCINMAYKSNKPFIIENVRSPHLFSKLQIPQDIFIYTYGRHTYFTNVMFSLENIPQRQDFLNGGILIRYYDNKSMREGGFNVNNVFIRFLEVVLNKEISDVW